jgi:oxazoline/thiazoline synthase
MISIPRFKAKYHIEHVSDVGVFLLSENENHVLEGDSLKRIAPLINGRNSWDDIIAELREDTEEAALRSAFDVLIKHGHVVENDDRMPMHFEPFWSELGLDSAQAHALIASANIHVRAVGNVDSAAFLVALRSFGFVLDLARPPSLIVVIADDYQYPAIAEINNYCIAHGIAWLLAKPSGLRPMIGPFFVPGRTACWQCLESRLRHNREVETFVQRKTGRRDPFPVARARIPLAEQQVATETTIQLIKWLSHGHHAELESRIVGLDVFSMQRSFHTVVRRPQCPACGNPALADIGGKPLHLQSRQALAVSENGSRLEPPEATFDRYAHHISEITGIVKGIFASPWNGKGPLRVYMAGHNFALKNDELFFLKDGLRAHSSGKGRSDAQARTSALCEALERYSGLFRADETTQITSSFRELGDRAVDLRNVLLFSDQQYAEREQWLARGSRFQVVPKPFDDEAQISWSPLWSCSEKRVKYLPTSYLYYGFRDSDEHFYAWGDSNGNAAGSTIEDAILQGFLELVERDAVAIWWYNRLVRPAVDLDSLKDPYYEELRDFYRESGREFWVLDLTTDTGIPTYAAINRRTDHSREDIIMGFGAHLDPRVAINRAVTEMNQFIPAVMNTDVNGDAQYAFDDKDSIEWWTTATLANQPYLAPDKTERRTLAPESHSGTDIEQQVNHCFAVAARLGLEVLILNQTRVDVGLPVVKVIVPGLRHFWARFAQGRLYDVPVQMQWLAQPRAESELNPIPMFV